MAKVFINGAWFEELSPKSLYESEYEAILLRYGTQIYPGFHIVKFKKKVYSEDGAAVPDLALINKSYTSWWVVEVEKSEHSLQGHVIPQVRKLSRAKYGIEEARYLCGNASTLNSYKVEQMVYGQQPKVLVIVDRIRDEWVRVLSQHDAEVAVVEIFRSDSNDAAFRINGFRPKPSVHEEVECTPDKVAVGLWQISSPSILPRSDRFIIYLDGELTSWTKLQTADQIWLIPEGACPLDPKSKYKLIKTTSNTLEFVRI